MLHYNGDLHGTQTREDPLGRPPPVPTAIQSTTLHDAKSRAHARPTEGLSFIICFLNFFFCTVFPGADLNVIFVCFIYGKDSFCFSNREASPQLLYIPYWTHTLSQGCKMWLNVGVTFESNGRFECRCFHIVLSKVSQHPDFRERARVLF